MVFEDIPVTIVGGGPNGLASALALARQGIASRVLERKSTTTDHPKSRGSWVRTMEIFRQWGVEAPIRSRGLPDGAEMIVMMDGGIGGKELGRSIPQSDLGQSPSRLCMVAQDAIEEALVTALAAQPLAEVHFSTEFTTFEEQSDGVAVTARDLASGKLCTWRSQYLIGADGGVGAVAKIAGISFDGRPITGVLLNTYFRADLSRFQCAREAVAIWFRHKDPARPPQIIANTNGADRWLAMTRIGADKDERERPLTEAETIAVIREALGLPDLDVHIINEAKWRLTRQIAHTFAQGRVYLVGDAAHRFPPAGGFGLNSGIQDVQNLAWKLAFVLRGWASEKLLKSYDLERRPAAHSNADAAMPNLNRLPKMMEAVQSGDEDRIRFWLIDIEGHIHNAGHILGGSYDNGAIISDGTTPPTYSPRVYTPTDRPGSRFPHLWLDAGKAKSTLDLFDRELVLVGGPKADSWLEATSRVSKRLSIPIRTHRLAEANVALGIHTGPRGAVLVRPDGIVAWRVGWQVADPETELASVIKSLLS